MLTVEGKLLVSAGKEVLGVDDRLTEVKGELTAGSREVKGEPRSAVDVRESSVGAGGQLLVRLLRGVV